MQKNVEWDLENTLLAGLGLNILETSRFIYSANHTGFDSFEEWIIETSGGVIEEARLTRLRDALAGVPVASAAGCLDDVPGLTAEEFAFWDEHGYVVVTCKRSGGQRSRRCPPRQFTVFLTPIPTIPRAGMETKHDRHTIWVNLCCAIQLF